MSVKSVRMLLLSLLLLVACSESRSGGGDERPTLFVSLAPQADLVQRIAGDRWDVQVLLPPGRSPATYDAPARVLAALARARLYIRIGAPFENGLLGKLAAAEGLTVVDQRERVTLLAPTGDERVDHDHADHADHHIWLDPRSLQLQAATIRDALAAADPAGAARYARNTADLIQELSALDRRITHKLHPYRGRSILVQHPAYNYFTEAYGLRQVAVEEHGREPSARHLAELTAAAREQGWKSLFVQREFSDRNARILAESVGADIVVLDPLAADLLTNLERMADTIAQRLQQEG